MSEAWSLTLPDDPSWHHLGGTQDKEPVEVVLRSFDRPVEFATGKTPDGPDGPPLAVPPGGGRRLEGLHFFARVVGPGGPSRVLVRGVEPAPAAAR